MENSRKTTLWFCLLLVGSLSKAAAVEAIRYPILWAALGSEGGGPPPCGKDGKCNAGACSDDPDCPKELDNKPDPVKPAPAPSRPEDIKDCTAKETDEIGLAIDWGAANWTEFEAVLEDIRDWPVTIGNCLENRFKKNGKVVCESSMKGQCTMANGRDANAWASPLNKKCHMCPDWLATIRAISGQSNRQACYFAIVTHEWGHTCERGHKTLEIIDDEAFNFWKSKHPDVTIDYSDCNMR